MLSLKIPVSSLKMIGPTFANRLKRLKIETVGDLLYHIPSRYEDFSRVVKINLLKPYEKVTVLGKVTSIKNIFTKHGKKIQKAFLTDETGEIEIVWYNQPFLLQVIREGTQLAVSGETKFFGHKLIFESPEYEIINKKNEDNEQTIKNERPADLMHTGRLVPVYPETEGISSKWLRNRIFNTLFKFNPEIKEILPFEILKKYHLMGEKEAVYKVHFPKNLDEAGRAKKRLAFDELLQLQMAAQIRKESWSQIKEFPKIKVDPYLHDIKEYIENLPFKLTQSQLAVIDEILTDFKANKPQNRLIEGDVGSGKTVVATVAIYLSHLNGFRSILMAPTEILAFQHYQTIKQLLRSYKLKIAFISSSKKLSQKTCDFDVLIGTHAIIYNYKTIKNLGLVIIDEQQRFGVVQRGKLKELATNPHLLTLTATPIPRTIALTFYADLDLSVIDEMPLGRLPVKTWVVPPEKRENAYQWIKDQIKESQHKNQVFIVCPFIEESETLSSIKAAKNEFEYLKTNVFQEFKMELLHGRLKPSEKQRIMKRMKNGQIDILVSTPVVEVGIDIPTATIILIEAAERFGLAQLHQLRGRVGRGNQQAYCLLFTSLNSPNAVKRLKYLEIITNGPKLAEIDLKLRGAGEIYGVRQHGQFKFKYADFGDLNLIKETKGATYDIFAYDKTLSNFPLLRERLQKYTIQTISNN